MTLLDRFRGEGGRRLCVEALEAQRLVSGNRKLAEDLADRAEALAVPAGQTLISQGAEDNDIYFILAGTFDVVVNGRRVAGRSAGDHVGEMAAVQPAQKVCDCYCTRRRNRCKALGGGFLESRFQTPPALSPNCAGTRAPSTPT